MKLHILRSKKYEKSFKKYFSSDLINLENLNFVINKIANGEKLPERYKDHKLKGDLKEFKECHVEPDILLIYQIKKKELVLILIGLGNHSDFFN